MCSGLGTVPGSLNRLSARRKGQFFPPPPVVCPYLSLSSARLLRVYTHSRQAGRQAGSGELRKEKKKKTGYLQSSKWDWKIPCRRPFKGGEHLLGSPSSQPASQLGHHHQPSIIIIIHGKKQAGRFFFFFFFYLYLSSSLCVCVCVMHRDTSQVLKPTKKK